MQTEGIAEAIRNAIQRRLATFREATVDVVAGGSRGGSKNAMIAAVQKAHARNPFYFDPDTRAVIRDRVHEAMQRDGGLTRDDLNAIGRLMVTGIESHFEAQRNPGGSTFRELTEEYAKAKRKKFGDKPILEATGELRNSMGVRVDVR
jgi:hypothetical protein